MATAEMLMTAEEFGRRPDPGYPEELVRGRIVALPPPRDQGKVSLRIGRVLDAFAREYGLGQAMTNGSGVITRRNPDSVRRADVAYYSNSLLPKGPLAPRVCPEVPELVFEVRSAGDSWREILIKVAEYLTAGVLKVVILDPGKRKAHVFSPGEEEPMVLGPDDELTLPGLLEGFRVPVRRFFD